MKSFLILVFSLGILVTSFAQMQIEPTVKDPAFGQKIEGYLSHTVPLIDVEELNSRYKEFLILDIRKKEEYKASHLKGATWLSPKIELNKYPAFSKNKPVLVYCSVGARSENMGEQFKKLGYEVYNLYGGIFEWVNRELPVYKKEKDREVESKTIHTFNFMFRSYVTNPDYKKVGLLNW